MSVFTDKLRELERLEELLAEKTSTEARHDLAHRGPSPNRD